MKYVFAYHEIVRSPQGEPAGKFDGARCDVVYRWRAVAGFLFSWIFPHGDTTSIGTGSAQKGFSLRGSVGRAARARPGSTRRRPFAAKARRSR